ncbi:hypothetical protein K501DRAFT_271764 [Backusella circina FSU 941]|nr:hypothetical protein K501DRAFT_271764 [Backusella circina FSU 941]
MITPWKDSDNGNVRPCMSDNVKLQNCKQCKQCKTSNNTDKVKLQKYKCCCSAENCPKSVEFNNVYERISLDSRLAAEIGKLLLEEKNSDQPYDAVKGNYEELVALRREKIESEKKIKYLLKELKLLKSESSQFKETIEIYENEMEKKKLWEHLLILKADVEDDLKNQVIMIKTLYELKVKELEFNLQETREMLGKVDQQYKSLNENYETLQLAHNDLKQEYRAVTILKSNNESDSSNSSDIFQEVIENDIPEAMSNVPRLQLAPIFPDDKNPFDILQVAAQEMFSKICNTDTRVLNRQLKRAFDQIELSEMSNSMIHDIMAELINFNKQFEWVYECHDPSVQFFFPLTETIQKLLGEIGNMKLTLNDLHTDYVTRIERLNTPSLQPNILYKFDRKNIDIIANEKRLPTCADLPKKQNKRNSMVIELLDKLLK